MKRYIARGMNSCLSVHTRSHKIYVAFARFYKGYGFIITALLFMCVCVCEKLVT